MALASTLAVVGLLSSAASGFVITVNGNTYDSAAGRVRVDKETCAGILTARGTHVSFDFDCSDFGVYNYTLTGAAADDRLVTEPTVIFTSKTVSLTSSQLAGASISRLQAEDADFEVRVESKAGKYKIQAKDQPQGGNFQIETEFGPATEYTHVLGPGLTYFQNPARDNKYNFHDGKPAVTKAQDPVNYHEELLGKDTLETATSTFQNETVAQFSVQSGGRLGGVLGEDANEL